MKANASRSTEDAQAISSTAPFWGIRPKIMMALAWPAESVLKNLYADVTHGPFLISFAVEIAVLASHRCEFIRTYILNPIQITAALAACIKSIESNSLIDG